jgi:hypothetical protein
VAGLPLLLELLPLLRRLDSRSPLRAQQAGFGHADLVKHDNMELGGNIGKAAMGQVNHLGAARRSRAQGCRSPTLSA